MAHPFWLRTQGSAIHSIAVASSSAVGRLPWPHFRNAGRRLAYDRLDEKLAQVVSAYSVASGVTAAAVRLGAIGALDGQKVLADAFP